MLKKVNKYIMAETERLRAVFDYLRENKIVRNQQDFVERIGSDKSTVSQILNGRIPIPNILFGKVVATFPQFDEGWLRSGEGSMLKPSVQQTSYGDHSPNVNGDGNHFGGCASIDRAFTTLDNSLAQNAAMLKTLDAALAEIAAQRELVAQSMAQTAMLIQLLQNQK